MDVEGVVFGTTQSIGRKVKRSVTIVALNKFPIILIRVIYCVKRIIVIEKNLFFFPILFIESRDGSFFNLKLLSKPI